MDTRIPKIYTLKEVLHELFKEDNVAFTTRLRGSDYIVEILDGKLCCRKYGEVTDTIPNTDKWNKTMTTRKAVFDVAFKAWLNDKKDIYSVRLGKTKYYRGVNSDFLTTIGHTVSRNEIELGDWYIVNNG